MWQKILNWWRNFYHKFFYTRREHDEVYNMVEAAFKAKLSAKSTQIAELIMKLQRATENYDELSRNYDKLNALYESEHEEYLSMVALTEQVKAQMEEVRNENLQLRQAPELNPEFMRGVQIQIGRIMENVPSYGYRNELVIPGSSCVITEPGKLDDHISVCGRTVLDDITTKEVNAAGTMYEKFVVVLNYVLRFGSFNRIIQALIQNGAVQFSLAYRESTTTYECFYNVHAKNFERDSLLVFDEPTGLGTLNVPEEEEKKEEGEA